MTRTTPRSCAGDGRSPSRTIDRPTVITGWVFTLGIVYWARFEQGCWKTMRVIEPDVVVESAPPVVERGAHTVADTLVAAAPEQSSG